MNNNNNNNRFPKHRLKYKTEVYTVINAKICL